ncbi:reverse transcriptase domain-containing protein [Tanacetum coccineum]|uniref:Reverse transcriptase domain-containing protein n=1 Tax=Tanacetum coccineum TaxID=301880 RepID=A0ABQ5I0M5_9ASTR
MTVVLNDDNELIPSRTVTGWRVCIDYRKLNDATRKDHFPLPFIDQMLKHLCGNEYYCFLDSFARFFQIPIALEDQEKTTFTCPYGTFAYRRMPFRLCNAPATFQRCMTAIFHDMVEDFMKVFMDDFSVSVRYNPKNWSEKLDDALWAFRTAYKTPTGCTPFRLVYGKACHLPVEIKQKAYWALKQCNMDLTAAAKNYFMELNEVNYLRYGAKPRTPSIYRKELRNGKTPDPRDKDIKVWRQGIGVNSRINMHPAKPQIKVEHPMGKNCVSVWDRGNHR